MKITYQSRRDFLKNSRHVRAIVFLNKKKYKIGKQSRNIFFLIDRHTVSFFIIKEKTLVKGNIHVQLAEDGKSNSRICQTEIDKEFGRFFNLEEKKLKHNSVCLYILLP